MTRPAAVTVLRVARGVAWVRIAIGAAVVAGSIGIGTLMQERGETPLVLAGWGFVCLAIAVPVLFTGVSRLIRPQVFAQLDRDGVTFSAQSVRQILWKNLLGARRGLATTTRRNTTHTTYRTPLILQVRDPQVLEGNWHGFKFRHHGHGMGDGTAEILIKTLGCPVTNEDLLRLLASHSHTKPDLGPANPATATLGGVKLNQPARAGFFYYLGASAFLLGGLFLAGHGVRTLVQAKDSLHWPTTEGVITSSKLETRTSSGGRGGGSATSYVPVIHYHYQVENVGYTGTRTAFHHDGSRKTAVQLLSRFPADARVPVYYDPQDPAEGVLVRNGHGLWIPISIDLLFATIGGWMLKIKRRRHFSD
ncbi:MAG: DUF3592 domain-containing protein [Rariglobus sp.]